MKSLRSSFWIISAFIMVMLTACSGGGGGSDGSSGTLAMDITDAKPMLPAGTKHVWISFEEVLVHKSGGGWVSLPLAQTHHSIDLLQFHSGNTTELVPPVSLEPGKYTQIRIVVSDANITIDDTTYSLTIPSENLKTDKNFDFAVKGGGAVDITVDFDLSKSIVVTGPDEYKLKPVLHIVHTSEAATIQGAISDDSFENTDSSDAIITILDNNGIEYTKVTVPRAGPDPAEFSIFWLVPNQEYTVEIDMDPEAGDGEEYTETVDAVQLQPGDIFALNSDTPIILP